LPPLDNDARRQKSEFGQLQRTELEAQGIKVVLAKEPTVVAGHAVTSGQIPRLTDFEKPLQRCAWRRAHRHTHEAITY